MTPERPSIYYVLQSRKFWMAVVGFVLILVTAITQGQELDANTIVNSILGIVAAYIAAVAFEDGMSKKQGSGPVQVASAEQVTIEQEPKP